MAEFGATREHVGPQADVCIDVHTRLSPIEAIELCKALEPYRPFFVEDAIRSENPEVFRLVRAKTSTRLATGEQLSGKWAFRELISENLVDYLRIDLCHVGGITETRKIANWAEAYYVETALHCTNGHVGDVASLHVDLALPNCGIQEYSGASRPLEGLLEGGFTMQQGHLVPSGEPGLGLRVDVEALGPPGAPAAGITPPLAPPGRRRAGLVARAWRPAFGPPLRFPGGGGGEMVWWTP